MLLVFGNFPYYYTNLKGKLQLQPTTDDGNFVNNCNGEISDQYSDYKQNQSA